MNTRRSFTMAGIAGGALLLSASQPSAFAQAASSPVASSQKYRGILTIQDLPTRPSAPEGACAIVLHASGRTKGVGVAYHNATEDVMAITSVSAIATNKYGTETQSIPEESNHSPHLLQPGEYGIAIPMFDSFLDEDDTVTVDIVAVPEAEADPAVVSLPVVDIVIREVGDSVFIENTVTNNTGQILAPGSGPLSVFLSAERELVGWLGSPSLREFDVDVPKRFEYGSNGLTVSDSFMMVFGGRTHA